MLPSVGQAHQAGRGSRRPQPLLRAGGEPQPRRAPGRAHDLDVRLRDLSPEQDQEVGYIRRAAQDLLELVNDLLDLAKVEAGKLEAKPLDFKVADLFAALRDFHSVGRGVIETIFARLELPFTPRGDDL